MEIDRPQLDLALELVPESVLLVVGSQVVFANRLAQEMFGLDAERGPFAVTELLVAGEAWPAEATTEPIVVRCRRADGSKLTASVRVGRPKVDGAAIDVVTVRDVTESHTQLERLRGAVEAARLGIYDHDHMEGVLWCSPRMRAQYGLQPDEPLALQTFVERFPVDSDLLEAITRAHDPAGDGHFDEEFPIVKADGSGSCWLHSRAQTYFGLVGGQRAPIRTIGAIVDVTRRKELEAQLLQAQKMEAIGQLAGGVAHDFNNLLSVILGAAGLAFEDLPEPHPARQELGHIQHAAQRASELTRQLLAFGRKQILRPQILRIDDMLESMRDMMQRLVGEDVVVSVYRSDDTGPVKLDPTLLEQVILNLVINARDAMSAGGRITLETQPFFADDAYAAAHPGMRPGRHTALTVSDTGQGMDEATRARIFEPFFTTKESGKGTGLGLAMVQGVVAQSGGSIWVYSEVGRGTTFKVYFPCARGTVENTPPRAVPRRPRDALILVVEDDAELRRVIVTILQRAGYTTLESGRPLEALALAEEHAQPVDLLLTDIVMPQMSGRELAGALTSKQEGLRVLYSSGYTENTIVHHGILEEGVHFLAKPVTPEALLAAVAEVLDAP